MKNQQGFTFIELLLYMTIVSIMMSVIILFAWDVIGTGTKSNTQQEVNSSARLISERIKYEIRNSFGVSSLSPTQLILCTNAVCGTTKTIDVVGGNVRITPGPVNLNSLNTTISNFTFTSYTSADTKTKHVGFLFTISDANSSTRAEFNETLTIRSSAEVRSS